MKKTWILFLLILSLFLQGCMSNNPYQNGTSGTESTVGNASLSATTASNGTSTQPSEEIYLYLSARANTLEPFLSTDDPFYLKIMNKTVNEFGGETYTPASLVLLDERVTPEKKEIELETRVAQALYAMLAEMEHDGIKDIMVTSGYRSHDRQKFLYNTYIQNEMNGFTDDAYACLGQAYIEEKYDVLNDVGLDFSDAERVVLSYSAFPGTSEHQTGLCVDFITDSMTKLTNAFERTAAFAWLSQNAYRFGFILRYPKDKTDITGYAYESWHYRYVGRDAAATMHFGSLTLEQYREMID